MPMSPSWHVLVGFCGGHVGAAVQECDGKEVTHSRTLCGCSTASGSV